jgi:hypothetical protein
MSDTLLTGNSGWNFSMKKRLNWKIILSNVVEAREQLEIIESRVREGNRPSEIELQLMLEHAYHHINFAWNIRHEKSERYGSLSDDDFNQWSKFPRETEPYKIPKQKRAS